MNPCLSHAPSSLSCILSHGLIALEGHKTGEIIFNTILSFFEEDKLDLERINMLVMDGEIPSFKGSCAFYPHNVWLNLHS